MSQEYVNESNKRQKQPGVGSASLMAEVCLSRKKTKASKSTSVPAQSIPPMPIQMINGRQDRLLASNRQFAEAFLPAEKFTEIEGGHEWNCWHQGMKIFLEK